MFQILITGFCLAAVLAPIATAQLQQNALGFQPTYNLTVGKGNRVGLRTTATPTPPPGWPAPPPPPPGGWPAIPPPPVGWPAPPAPPGGWQALPPNDCTDPGTPVSACPNQYDPAYVASSNCECFFQCSNGQLIPQPCPSGLYFNPSLNVCDYPDDSGCGLLTPDFDTDLIITIGG